MSKRTFQTGLCRKPPTHWRQARVHCNAAARRYSGKSPLAYFQDLRVEEARSMIQGSNLNLEAIAAKVGYADGATLRKLSRLRLG